MFVWLGDVRLFLAIIKHVEDRLNAGHDAEVAGVARSLNFYPPPGTLPPGSLRRDTRGPAPAR